MVEMPTHEETWFESVLFLKYDAKCSGKFHSNGNIAMEASFQHGVIQWDSVSGRAELEADTRHVAMVLRVLGFGEIISSFNSCGQAPKVGRSTAGRGC